MMALRDGLVGAWCPSLGTSAGLLLDRSGRNNHGTLTNMDQSTDWVASDGGLALDIFDSQWVDLGFLQGLSLAYPFAMSCWVLNMTSAGADFSPFSKLQEISATYPGAGIVVGSSSGPATAFWNGATRATGATTVTNRTAWTQIGICWTGAQAQVVVNGRIDGTGATTAAPSAASSAASVGRYVFRTSNRSMRGQVDDCAIWTRCLTPGEWLQLYTLGRGKWLRQTQRRTYGFVAGFNRRRRLICGANC